MIIPGYYRFYWVVFIESEATAIGFSFIFIVAIFAKRIFQRWRA
jgi:hypothetical protein